MKDSRIVKGLVVLFLFCLILMTWFYSQGYNNSIGWEVTTTADVIQYPGIQVEGELMSFEVKSDKYLLNETYSGGSIKRNRLIETLIVSLAWIGTCITLVGASFLKRFGFLLALALFTLFLNRLNFGDIGLFGVNQRLIVIVPFVALVGPLFYFQEYRPKTSFLIRLTVLIIFSTVIAIWGISNHSIFLDHFISHSNFPFAISGLLFLLAIAEENIFAVLFLVSRGKGGKSNHLHFIVLCVIYLINLILYYLNKSGYVPNSFSFFDPFVLLIISSLVAIWSLRFKANALPEYFPNRTFLVISIGLGIAFISILNLALFKGLDAFYESFHYFILYFHIGFGVFFFLYIVINFIDPLAQGLEVYKVVYRERHFPYLSARLGGLMVVLGFYFLSTQEAYRLLRSAYYADLGTLEQTLGDTNLANEYFEQAAFLGYNTHFANYQLAWNHSGKGNEYLTKTYFENAASRFPSPFAYVNYAMLDMEINPVKVQAVLGEAAQRFPDGEVRNNQGILRMKNREWEKALDLFGEATASNSWNRAPLLNKWAVLYRMNLIDSVNLSADYEQGNYGVKTNMMLFNVELNDNRFIFEDLQDAPDLHRQAYLLNSTSIQDHDSLVSFAKKEIDNSTNATFNDRLRKGLVVYHYNRGEVNKAFQMLDYLQANSYSNQRGGYLNDLGVLAIDQGAYQLALDFFNQAIDNDYFPTEINRLEALAALGRANEIPNELLAILEKDPGLTTMANQILTNLKQANFEYKSPALPSLDSLSVDEIVLLASQNAFNTELVIEAVNLLNDREVQEAYDVILEATEINPYEVELLKSYAMIALDQNLTSYAEAVLPDIEQLISAEAYEKFIEDYQAKLDEVSKDSW